jgi:hypothetical protein
LVLGLQVARQQMAGERASRLPEALLMGLIGAIGGGAVGSGGVALNQLAGDLVAGDENPGYTPDELGSIAVSGGTNAALWGAILAAGALMDKEEEVGYDGGGQPFFGQGVPNGPQGPRPYRPGDFAIPMDDAVQRVRVHVV